MLKPKTCWEEREQERVRARRSVSQEKERNKEKSFALHRIHQPTSWKVHSKPLVFLLCNYLNPQRSWEGFEGSTLLECVVQRRHWRY